MPFKTKTAMEQKLEFVTLADSEGANISKLCRRFGISRVTGYTWIGRHKKGDGLAERSRRPHTSPGRTNVSVEDAVVRLRQDNPAWGSKKLRKVLERDGLLGASNLPSKTTITAIIKRKGFLGQKESERAQHWQRFERAQPNELWQMDFKGYFSLQDKTVCHPLTVTDDHSRYSIGLFTRHWR